MSVQYRIGLVRLLTLTVDFYRNFAPPVVASDNIILDDDLILLGGKGRCGQINRGSNPAFCYCSGSRLDTKSMVALSISSQGCLNSHQK